MKRLASLVDATIRAYKDGAFPMAEDGELGFYSCDPRSVFMFDSFHAPKRLLRIYRGQPFDLHIDSAFGEVVENCRVGRPEWISPQLAEIYAELFSRGHAHSVEAWKDGNLVGGIYGTQFGAAFLAESMFHTETHASNVCLIFLMERLKAGGFLFCDIQYANPHTLRFHPVRIPRERFMTMYRHALRCKATLKA